MRYRAQLREQLLSHSAVYGHFIGHIEDRQTVTDDAARHDEWPGAPDQLPGLSRFGRLGQRPAQ